MSKRPAAPGEATESPATRESPAGQSPTIAEKKVFGTEDSERDITDEFPVITEQMLSTDQGLMEYIDNPAWSTWF